MAKKVVVQILDDIDGSNIPEGQGEHIVFAVDGVTYEIDLNAKNAREFRKKIGVYVDHAVKASGRPQSAKRTSVKAKKRDAEHTQAIREWAREKGYDVSSRGRISAKLEQAYNEEH